MKSCFDFNQNWACLLGRPYVLLQMFYFLFILPQDLRAPLADRREIFAMWSTWLNFIMQVQSFGAAP